MSSRENGGPTPNGDGPPRNTRHPTGIRATVILLGAMCVLLGPIGYAQGVASSASTSAAEWFTLGFGASVGLPLLGAAIATVAGDRRAALYSLILLAWPVVFVAAIHLRTGA